MTKPLGEASGGDRLGLDCLDGVERALAQADTDDERAVLLRDALVNLDSFERRRECLAFGASYADGAEGRALLWQTYEAVCPEDSVVGMREVLESLRAGDWEALGAYTARDRSTKARKAVADLDSLRELAKDLAECETADQRLDVVIKTGLGTLSDERLGLLESALAAADSPEERRNFFAATLELTDTAEERVQLWRAYQGTYPEDLERVCKRFQSAYVRGDREALATYLSSSHSAAARAVTARINQRG